MSKSELEKYIDKIAQNSSDEGKWSPEEIDCWRLGALHLLDYLADYVKEAVKIPTLRANRLEARVYNDGYDQGCKDMLVYLKSYCGRE